MTANQPDHPWAPTPNTEPLEEGGLWLLDLVAAVTYLRRGFRPDFTVWAALEEALRSWTTEDSLLANGAPDPDRIEPTWGVEDPLRDTLRHFLAVLDAQGDSDTAVAMQRAVRRWTTTMSERFNAGCGWS
jgi:hypothetical protein